MTCFSTADLSLLLVDWITSGRHERGEKWDFELYKSMNHIFHDGDEPLFLDTAKVEACSEPNPARCKENNVSGFTRCIWSKGIGVVTRIAAMTTESVYNFLQHQLSSMEPLLSVQPYS
ncbi:hypothetical protein K7X08_017276 [Anisodus acutangulus]|uniref:Uncharacterized protein n=1 Tax=Anisodus acutangulus TaxID=402998 RepID=A0A9Q1R7M6_9SOLA|nr:hypothetical protein K7X08_017276 [Anisodus acutangulus]